MRDLIWLVCVQVVVVGVLVVMPVGEVVGLRLVRYVVVGVEREKEETGDCP